jgi:N-formylglutamate amidohydrolase
MDLTLQQCNDVIIGDTMQWKCIRIFKAKRLVTVAEKCYAEILQVKFGGGSEIQEVLPLMAEEDVK